MDLSLFCLFPLIIIVGLPAGEAIWCYECNSGDIYDNGACASLAATDTSSSFRKNCSEYGQRDDHEYERCRVVVQDVEGDIRIVRSCATWPDKNKPNRCVDRTGTHKIKVRYCECEGDNCNGSSRIYGSLSLFLATLLSLLVANSMCR